MTDLQTPEETAEANAAQPSPKPEQTGPYRRFTLLPEGVIALQLQETNPLPGPSVARIRKGPHWIAPEFDLIDESLASLGQSAETVQEWVAAWLPAYIHETLPFTKPENDVPEKLQPLLMQVAERGGIAERAKLTLPELTAEDRATLRTKGLRLGPVHIYYHAMLKPAPLTLRALLWATYEDMKHPLPYPRPGVTSYSWPEEVTPDAEVQHWFGYPLYARRGCRVDRIDKIICDVYDTAAKGVFTVKNAWAEWLGCKVDDVCQILEELGHTRIPAPEAVAEEAPAEAPAEGAPAETKVPVIQFRLKSDKPRTERAPRADRGPRKDRDSNKKPREKREGAPSGDNVKKFERKPPYNKEGKKGGKPQGKPERKFGDETPMTASPFANLKDMLKG